MNFTTWGIFLALGVSLEGPNIVNKDLESGRPRKRKARPKRSAILARSTYYCTVVK